MSNTIQTHYNSLQRDSITPLGSIDITIQSEHVRAIVQAPSHGHKALYEQQSPQRVNKTISSIGKPGSRLITVFTTGTKAVVLTSLWPTSTAEHNFDLDEISLKSSWTKWAEQTKEALHKRAAIAKESFSASARLRVARLSALQASFGLTRFDLASVLGITRPQLYKWLDSTHEINLQESSRLRLASAERIANEWSSRTNTPLGTICMEQLFNGGNVFEMLKAATMDEIKIFAAFDELIDKLQEKPSTPSQNLRKAGYTRRPSIRKFPSDE